MKTIAILIFLMLIISFIFATNTQTIDSKIIKKQITLSQNAINETARIQKLIDDGNIKLGSPIYKPFYEVN